jgi:hypothetical protein
MVLIKKLDENDESEELVKKQFYRYDVSNKKTDDNLHPLSRFLFLTINYAPKLGGDFGKY